MYMLVTPMRLKGIDLTHEERRKYPAVKGDVQVACVQDSRLGRAANRADVLAGPGMHKAPLPPLYDAKLSGMATLGFVLSGFEIVDGCAYAQSWWCRKE